MITLELFRIGRDLIKDRSAKYTRITAPMAVDNVIETSEAVGSIPPDAHDVRKDGWW